MDEIPLDTVANNRGSLKVRVEATLCTPRTSHYAHQVLQVTIRNGVLEELLEFTGQRDKVG